MINVTFLCNQTTTEDLIIDINKFNFKSHEILAALPQAQKEVFMNSCDVLRFKKGKLLFYEGGIPTGVFLLKTGRAKIYKTGLDGKDQIFYIYKAGDLLGYHALLCDEKFEDSCEILEESEVLFMGRDDFDLMLDKTPRLNDLIIKNMAHEFGVLVNTITVLAQKPLRERLAINLLILEERYQNEKSDNIDLPREDLANIIGTARESLGRLLKEFREEGLIDIDQKSIFLKDRKKIHRIASSIYT